MKPYKNINDPQRSFVSAYVERHSQKVHFFNRVKSLIDWDAVDAELKKVYTKGMSEKGAKAYSPLLLFRMALISEWYNLSDKQTEIMVNDSLSAMKFCDLRIEDSVPGHTTLYRFKNTLRKHGIYNSILENIQNNLAENGLQIKKGRGKTDAKIVKKKLSK